MSRASSSPLFAGYQVAADLNQYGTMYLLPCPPTTEQAKAFWLIAEYKSLTKLAKNLRHSASLRALVASYHVRIGLRESDILPTARKQQKGFGADVLIRNAKLDHRSSRTEKDAATATVNELVAANAVLTGKDAKLDDASGGAHRLTDQYRNLQTYWAKKTPECHHIVEDNQLRALGVSHKTGGQPLDHAHLPCVLLAAEFHQEYITPILQPTRLKADTVLAPAQRPAYHKTLSEVYAALYERNGALFLPLWKVAERILTAAQKKL